MALGRCGGQPPGKLLTLASRPGLHVLTSLIDPSPIFCGRWSPCAPARCLPRRSLTAHATGPCHSPGVSSHATVQGCHPMSQSRGVISCHRTLSQFRGAIPCPCHRRTFQSLQLCRFHKVLVCLLAPPPCSARLADPSGVCLQTFTSDVHAVRCEGELPLSGPVLGRNPAPSHGHVGECLGSPFAFGFQQICCHRPCCGCLIALLCAG